MEQDIKEQQNPIKWEEEIYERINRLLLDPEEDNLYRSFIEKAMERRLFWSERETYPSEVQNLCKAWLAKHSKPKQE